MGDENGEGAVMHERAINWTWENAKERYAGFWKPGDILPDEVLADNELTAKTKQAFAGGSALLFEPLRSTQPKTYQALLHNCLPPVLLRSKRYASLLNVVTVVANLVVFVEPFAAGDELRDWAELRSCLPNSLHGYYDNFNGMHASFSMLSPAALNLPVNADRWRRAADYRKENNLKPKVLARLKAELGDPDNVFIFIETEWGDLVMVNRNTHDQKIYVAPEGKFEEFFVLHNPGPAIDALCAHVLTGTLDPHYLRRQEARGAI